MGRIIALGQRDAGGQIRVDESVLSTHTHVIGRTGTGKTKFLESLIRQFIRNKQGCCFIDPHGELFNDLVRWCETHRYFGRRNIVLFDPSMEGWTFGFNPFFWPQGLSEEQESFVVSSMKNACRQVWGGEDANQMPRLERVLSTLFYTIVENDLTLDASLYLLNPDPNHPIRQYFSKRVQNPVARAGWERLNALTPKAFVEETESTANRLQRFLESPLIRRMLSQKDSVLDMQKLMDDNAILLVNLGGGGLRLHKDAADTLGALMINDIVLKARVRGTGREPFNLVVDECHRYLNPDITEILAEMRKYGLHTMLAHQDLGQLRDAGEKIYSGVMSNARTKVVFSVSYEDADLMAHELFTGHIDYEQVKHVLHRTTVVGYEKIVLKGGGHTRGTARTETEMHGESEMSGYGASTAQTSVSGGNVSYVPGANGDIQVVQSFQDSAATMIGNVATTGRGSTTARGSGISEIDTTTESWSEALMPILRKEPGAVFSLDEQYNKAAAFIMNMEQGKALVKLPNGPPVGVTVEWLKDGYARLERVEKAKILCHQENSAALPTEKALDNMREVHTKICKKVGASEFIMDDGSIDFNTDVIDDDVDTPQEWQ